MVSKFELAPVKPVSKSRASISTLQHNAKSKPSRLRYGKRLTFGEFSLLMLRALKREEPSEKSRLSVTQHPRVTRSSAFLQRLQAEFTLLPKSIFPHCARNSVAPLRLKENVLRKITLSGLACSEIQPCPRVVSRQVNSNVNARKKGLQNSTDFFDDFSIVIWRTIRLEKSPPCLVTKPVMGGIAQKLQLFHVWSRDFVGRDGTRVIKIDLMFVTIFLYRQLQSR